MNLKSLAYAGLVGAVGLSTLLPATGGSAAPKPAAGADATAKMCPKVVAHRGGEGDPTDANENSMGAFKRGANIGVDVMETDVWFTEDLVPVIMHDETLDRTTDGTGKVSDYTWAYLKKNVRLNNGERIPSLKKALQFFTDRDLPSFVEYKDADDPQLYKIYVQHLKKYGKDAWGAGFSKDLLEWIHQHDRKRDLMWFGNKGGALPAPSDVPAGANPGIFNILLTDAAVVGGFTDAGLKMNVWYNTITKGDNPTGEGGPGGISDGLGWEGQTQFGVHWISTDYPDKYKTWTQQTGLCVERPAKESTVTCLTLPQKMRPGTTYTILPEGCQSSAGKKVKVKVTADPATAKVRKRQGSTLLKTTRTGGRVTLKYRAANRTWTTGNGNSWESYTSYAKTKRYVVAGRGGTPALG